MKSLGLVFFSALLCQGSAHGLTPQEKKATIAYLQSLQTAGGGFLPFKPAPTSGALVKPSLRATSAALRALKYFGGEVPAARAAARFVESCFDKTKGGFIDSPPSLNPQVFSTAVGLMAVAELKMPVEKYADQAVKYLNASARSFEDIRIAAAGLEALKKLPPKAPDWVKQIQTMRHEDGTFGKDGGLARVTASAIVTLVRLGSKEKPSAKVIQAIKAGQRKDGGYGKEDAAGSDLETCYRVLRCLVMLKEKPTGPGLLRQFVAQCRNSDGGYGVAPGQRSSAGGTYFASIILYWLGDK
jgi:prenyltransferase beta subunit